MLQEFKLEKSKIVKNQILFVRWKRIQFLFELFVDCSDAAKNVFIKKKKIEEKKRET